MYVVVVKSLDPIKKSLRLTALFKLALTKTRLVTAKGAIRMPERLPTLTRWSLTSSGQRHAIFLNPGFTES